MNNVNNKSNSALQGQASKSQVNEKPSNQNNQTNESPPENEKQQPNPVQQNNKVKSVK
jgi:hypothetical protein